MFLWWFSKAFLFGCSNGLKAIIFPRRDQLQSQGQIHKMIIDPCLGCWVSRRRSWCTPTRPFPAPTTAPSAASSPSTTTTSPSRRQNTSSVHPSISSHLMNMVLPYKKQGTAIQWTGYCHLISRVLPSNEQGTALMNMVLPSNIWYCHLISRLLPSNEQSSAILWGWYCY